MTIILGKTRFIIHLILIILVYFLSQTPNLIPEMYGIKPNLLLLLALNISLFEEQNYALGMGIICGVFMDMGFGEYFGFYTTIISAGCLFISILKEKVYKINLIKAYIFTVCFVSFSWIMTFCLMLVLNNINQMVYILILKFFISILYSTALEFIFYFLTKLIILLTTKKQKNMSHLLIKKTKFKENYNFLGSD